MIKVKWQNRKNYICEVEESKRKKELNNVKFKKKVIKKCIKNEKMEEGGNKSRIEKKYCGKWILK